MSKTILIFFLIVFAIVGAIGLWYWHSNSYSKETLKLEILGPENVQAGQEIEYLVKLKNNGKVRAENPELIFQVPDKSILEGQPSRRIIQKIEDIYPGEERSYSFKARLFGKKNEILKAMAWLDYNPKNLKTRFEAKTSFSTKIKFVPITFEFDLPSKTEANSQIAFSLNYFSNIDYLLDNLIVKIEYPEGFSFESASPKAIDEANWSLPSLYKASGGRIEIRGILEGREGEDKVFRAQLGIVKDGSFWLLKETSQSVKITESSLYISTLINNSQNYVASVNDLLHYEIFFRNIGRAPLQKKFLFVKLNGDFFDLSSLKSDKGEFGQGDNTILWDWKNVPRLRFLDAGEEGKVEFWVRLKKNPESQIENPKISVDVNLGGTEKLFETKVNSRVELGQKAYFQQEFFDNRGPVPPQAGHSTQYVILWQVKNYWNKLKNVKVKGVLPANVKPTGKIFPEEAKFTYDSLSRTVMWNIGDVEPWKGIKDEPLTLAFQVELIPASSQKGMPANLIGRSEISGEDDWTFESVKSMAEGCNTTLPDDATISSGEGIVR